MSIQPGQPSPSDLELVQSARRGDAGAFHILVDRHTPLLYGLALRLLGNAADTEDVLQETFAGAFRGLRGFREQSSVKTWLTQILFRQASKLYRSEQRRRRITFDAQSAGRTPPAPQGRADARMDLAEAILALRPEHREVIVLRELQALSYDEIAAILGLPRGTVESRLFRARRELQELLKDYLP